jgi:Peptidase C80 family.
MTVLFNHGLQEHQTKEAVGIAKRNGDKLKLFHLMGDVAPLKKTGLFSFMGFGSVPAPTETLHLIGHGSGTSFAGMTAQQLATALKGKGMDKARFKDIVLHSCSTGSEVDGIASRLAVEMDMTVTAPTGTLSLDGLTVYSGKSGSELQVEMGTTTFTSDGRGYVPPTKFL